MVTLQELIEKQGVRPYIEDFDFGLDELVESFKICKSEGNLIMSFQLKGDCSLTLVNPADYLRPVRLSIDGSWHRQEHMLLLQLVGQLVGARDVRQHPLLKALVQQGSRATLDIILKESLTTFLNILSGDVGGSLACEFELDEPDRKEGVMRVFFADGVEIAMQVYQKCVFSGEVLGGISADRGPYGAAASSLIARLEHWVSCLTWEDTVQLCEELDKKVLGPALRYAGHTTLGVNIISFLFRTRSQHSLVFNFAPNTNPEMRVSVFVVEDRGRADRPIEDKGVIKELAKLTLELCVAQTCEEALKVAEKVPNAAKALDRH